MKRSNFEGKIMEEFFEKNKEMTEYLEKFL